MKYTLNWFFILLTGALLLLNSCRVDFKGGTEHKSSLENDRKQRGAHIFGIGESTDLTQFKNSNIEWITAVPWGFMYDETCSEVTHHDCDSARILKSNEACLNRFQNIRNQGFKLFVKPHVWIDKPSEGKWRQDISPQSTEDWKEWETTYTDFIMRYARIAALAEAEMFCIGTEFSAIATQKPELWSRLIRTVKSVYSGPITYAANWHNEYEQVEFWGELDYIGIQAYFPLSTDLEPSLEELKLGWGQHLNRLKAVHSVFDKPIIFTEMGYKSAKDAAVEPWSWAENQRLDSTYFSPQTQANCYQAFFDTVWVQPWFEGAHLWQMRSDHHERDSAYYSLDFTPQSKPALEVISRNFSN